MPYIKLLEKQEQAKPKSSRRRKILKNKGWNQQNRDLKKNLNKEPVKQKVGSLKR
jgi:hypothetical protein